MHKGKKYTLPAIKSLMAKIAAKHGLPEQMKNTWEHSRVVYRLADKIARLAIKNNYKVDRDLIRIGCFVHDIGRMITGSKGSKVLKPGVYHGYEGYKILKKQGYPEILARFCLVHLGGTGLDKIDNQRLGFFSKDTLTETREEKILAYADARTDYNQKKKKEEHISFAAAYHRFNKYPRYGPRLKKNYTFIKKITKGKIN